jgi:hypothetical protein
MRKFLPQFRVLSSYISLALLFSGWAAFVLVFIQVQVPFSTENAVTSNNLAAQRMAAIEEAKKQGKHEYSFSTNKVPVPLSP